MHRECSVWVGKSVRVVEFNFLSNFAFLALRSDGVVWMEVSFIKMEKCWEMEFSIILRWCCCFSGILFGSSDVGIFACSGSVEWFALMVMLIKFNVGQRYGKTNAPLFLVSDVQCCNEIRFKIFEKDLKLFDYCMDFTKGQFSALSLFKLFSTPFKEVVDH